MSDIGDQIVLWCAVCGVIGFGILLGASWLWEKITDWWSKK